MLHLRYGMACIGVFITLLLLIVLSWDARAGERREVSEIPSINSPHLPPALDDLSPRDLELYYRIGMTYYYGHGVGKNRNIAVAWLKTAAENGYAQAQFQMGLDMSGNASDPEDVSKGIQWFRMAAEQGHPDAQAALGLALYEGGRVAQDKAAALKWLSRAATAGQKTAQHFLDQKHIAYEAKREGEEQSALKAPPESTDGDETLTRVVAAIRGGQYKEAVSLIHQSGHSNWLVSMKAWKEIAEPGRHVSVWGEDPKAYPLLSAVAALGEVSVAQALITHGADIDARMPGEESTALMAAAKMKHLPMLRLLLENHADITPATASGSSPFGRGGRGALDMAIDSAEPGEEEDIALALLKSPRITLLLELRSWTQKRVMLEEAAYRGLARIFDRLAGLGLDLFTPNRLGASPIHYAVMGGEKGGEQIALSLIGFGENPNKFYATDGMMTEAKKGRFAAKDRRQGKTVLIIAIEEKAGPDFIERLIKNGADVNLRSLSGDSPLEVAVNCHYDEMAALLRKHDAR